jgi:hypothetical protein
VSALACGAVLLGHAGRKAAALTDRNAVFFRSGPDITRALPVAVCPARRPPGRAGVPGIGVSSLPNTAPFLAPRPIS